LARQGRSEGTRRSRRWHNKEETTIQEKTGTSAKVTEAAAAAEMDQAEDAVKEAEEAENCTGG
jgi:hypothetical protein